MLGVLVQIDARGAGGEPLPVRLASHDLPDLCHAFGVEWDPALARLPDFALDFFGGSFSGQVTAPRTTFSVMTLGVAGFGINPAYRAQFADARVRIWVGDALQPGMMTLRFDGRIGAEPEIDEGARLARFDAAVQDSWASDPLLPLFAGTGGLEGPQDMEGQPKPLVLGNVRFARGVLIDNIDNVWMVSSGAVEGVSAVYDRLASLGASSGDHADLAALLAATVPNGSWATCLAQGLVRLGAPPDGRITFDVQGSNAGVGGYVRRPGAMIRRIADLAGGAVNAASLTALDAARPYNLQLQLTEQTTARDVIAQIADSVAAVAGVSLTGELFAQPLGIGAATERIDADGSSALRVASVEELAKSSPAWRLATEAELTFELHSVDEAAFAFRWQGPYSPDRVYRADDVVTGPDGSAFVYIAEDPAAGAGLPVHPAQSNASWLLFGASPVPVSGVLADRPASGDFVGQTFSTTDTGELFRWSGSAWIVVSDVTSEAARSIEPQFATIEIRQFEAGNVGSRTVSHFAKRGEDAIGGGTWSLVQTLLGDGSSSINSGTGLVTLSSITQSGSYTIRYTHTDGVKTDLKINVTFIAQEATVRSINASPAVATWFESATTSRIVAHTAIEGGSTLSGGTWSLASTSGGISASINSGTGAVTISSVSETGNYRVRYTHTDTVETELVVNVIFYPSGDPGRPIDPDYSEP